MFRRPCPSTDAARSVETDPDENDVTFDEKSSTTESPLAESLNVSMLVVGSTSPRLNLSNCVPRLVTTPVESVTLPTTFPCSSMTLTIQSPGLAVALVSLVNWICQVC